MSREPSHVDSQNLADLTESQWETLFDWADKYTEKYPLV
eukprot:gene5650-6834_t